MAHREIPCSAAGAEAAVMPEAVAVGPWARNGADPAAVLLTPNRLELIFLVPYSAAALDAAVMLQADALGPRTDAARGCPCS